jgi:hypothetical protein
MEASERLKRALQNEWELHGDPKQLCLILREEILARQMTDDEKEVMRSLTEFWNGYVGLPSSLADPLCRDVQNAVHAIQGAMAIRVAGRCNPEIWRTE